MAVDMVVMHVWMSISWVLKYSLANVPAGVMIEIWFHANICKQNLL